MRLKEYTDFRDALLAKNAGKPECEHEKAHFGRVFCITVEKNSELPEHDPLRRF